MRGHYTENTDCWPVCVQAAAEGEEEGGTRDRVKERLQTVLGTLFQDLGTDSIQCVPE